MQDPQPTRLENVDAVAGAVIRRGGNGGVRKVEVSPGKLLDAELLGFLSERAIGLEPTTACLGTAREVFREVSTIVISDI
jgi:hypothetical protein